MNLCSEKMNALVDKTNLDIIIQDDNSKDIEIKPKFCGINLNDKNDFYNKTKSEKSKISTVRSILRCLKQSKFCSR